MNNDLISRKDLYIAVDKMFEEPPIGSPEHGEWILNPGDLYNDATWVCSVCGHEWVLIDGTPQENDMHYCPKCGARMDGGNEE